MQYCSDELITETVSKKDTNNIYEIMYIKIVFVHINLNKTYFVKREREKRVRFKLQERFSYEIMCN